MSDTHDFSQVEALYQKGWRYNLQQKPQVTISGLTDACDYNRNYTGEGSYFNSDWMDSADPMDQDSRIPETVWREIGKERRVGSFRGSYDARVIEDIDKIREGAQDPQGQYVVAMRSGRERKERAKIIAAVFGNGYRKNEDDTITAIPLPASQKIAADFDELHEDESPTAVDDKFPLTFGKILHAQQQLDDLEIPQEGRILMASSYQLKRLAMSKVGSNSLYMQDLKAIIAGKSNMLGDLQVKKITGRGTLPYVSGTTTESCALYHKSAIQYRARDIKTLRIRELEKYGFRLGVYYEYEDGAARMLDEAVFQIDCYRPTNA